MGSEVALQKNSEPSPRNMRAGVKGAALALSLLASAYLMARGMTAPAHSWLAWVALLPLFAAIRNCRPLEGLLSGGVWGFFLYTFAATSADTNMAQGWLSLTLVTAIPAIYAYLGARLTRWIGFNPLVLGVGWMGVALTAELLGLHNGLLAGTQGGGSLLHWVGGALGYVLAAFLVAFVSALLVSALSRVRAGIVPRRYLFGPDEAGTHLAPQTFCCFPLFAIPPCRPRGPPTVL